MSYRATFNRTFAAAHRVWNDEGKCRNIHGHNYQVTVSVEASRLTAQGFTIPFDAIKGVVDQFDHALVLDVADPILAQMTDLPVRIVTVSGLPSTEMLAHTIAVQIRAAGGGGLERVEVALRETDGILAFAEC